jgi:hypothetical protein
LSARIDFCQGLIRMPVFRFLVATCARLRLAFLTCAALPAGAAGAQAATLPEAAFAHVGDYTYGYWADGYRAGSRIFNFQTSRYGLSFDYDDFTLQGLGPLAAPPTEAQALTQRAEDLTVALNPVLISDSFDSGSSGATLAAFDNALGGRLSGNWIVAPAQIPSPTYLTQGGGLAAQASYDCTLAPVLIDPARTYSLSSRVNLPEGMDGSIPMFAGLAFKIQSGAPEFWATSGCILRIFNDGGMDIKYGRTNNTLNFVAAGNFAPAADVDAQGWMNVRVDFNGAGTTGSPLQARVYVNGRQRAAVSINDLNAGDRVGFAAPYSGQFDDFVLRDMTQAPTLTCTLRSGSSSYNVLSGTTGSPGATQCQLVETGKFFQRRYLRGLNWTAGVPALSAPYTGLEFAAWPDRLATVLRVRPTAAVANGQLEMRLTLPEAYNQVLSSGNARALLDTSGAGFIFLPDSAATSIAIATSPVRVTVTTPVVNWSANGDRAVGFVIYPVSRNGSARLAQIAAQEANPVTVTARQLAPITSTLGSSYNPQLGWHQINLRDDNPTGPANQRIERVAVMISNPSAQTRTVRLNFQKQNNVYGVTGISAMLRDTDLFPTGIPVQHSKNWHATPGSPERYEGGWWRGLTMLAVPPNTTLNLEYDSVNALWGTLPAASHAQLCVIGYGGNQQWDEAAMGSWGESITYDPDVNLQRSMIDDVRPFMVTSLINTQYDWTNNLGGGDFLLYRNASNTKQWNSRMKTQFKRYSPNMTEVTYAGMSADGKIEIQCTAYLFRNTDLMRAMYHLRYDVKQPVTFDRLAWLQIAADNYSDGIVNRMAIGNAAGMTDEWTPAKGGLSYSRSRQPLPGHHPWISMHEMTPPSGTVGAYGNRAMLVRSWDARIQGNPSTTPYYSVYGSQNGLNSAIAELSLPPGVNNLQPGDYVDAWVTHIIMPQFAADYYGPNVNMEAALNAPGFENSWRLLHREAQKNDVDVAATIGVVEREYPPRITAVGDEAEFTITGGLAYVPLSIRGLTAYTEPLLYEKVGSSWVLIDQSNHGNDFWQMDYEPSSQTWEVTYNVNTDQPADARVTREFRFQAGPPVPVEVSAFGVE